MKVHTIVACLLCSCLGANRLSSQGQQGNTQEQLTRLQQEFQKYMNETDQSLDNLENRLIAAGAGESSKNSFLITGYGFAGFATHEGEPSTFGAQFNPIFLWKHGDKLFFESEVEFELDDDVTEVALEYAQLSYVLTDGVTLAGGKILNPANFFIERLHPAWINKLPDHPLAFGDEVPIQGESQVGFQVRGGVPVGPRKFEYALFVANGPRLQTDATAPDVGMLTFDNFVDNNNNKTVGGRVGIFPIPEAEIGYGVEIGKVDATGTSASSADFTIQDVDFNYTRDVEALSGTIDVRAQWVWSDVDNVTYDPTGVALTFDNKRNGGYAQLAYRPSKLENEIAKNLEGVIRFDSVDLPSGAPIGVDVDRWTFGVDYWVDSSSVVKLAYQTSDITDPSGTSTTENAFLIQFAMGF